MSRVWARIGLQLRIGDDLFEVAAVGQNLDGSWGANLRPVDPDTLCVIDNAEARWWTSAELAATNAEKAWNIDGP